MAAGPGFLGIGVNPGHGMLDSWGPPRPMGGKGDPMKRVAMAIGMAALLAGCASQDESAMTPAVDGARLGAADSLGWQLQTNDRAVTSASAEEHDLASHE